MYYVYILHSSSRDNYYVGHTSNLKDRMKRHNSGRSKATKAGIPWDLIYTEAFETKSEAYQREIQIKAWKNKRMILKLLSRF